MIPRRLLRTFQPAFLSIFESKKSPPDAPVSYRFSGVPFSQFPSHLHFCDSLFSEKAGLWPECEGVARKKHRREKKCGRRPRPVSAKRGGPIGRPAGRPYSGITIFSGKEWLARPVQEVRNASWFFRATALLSGLATPKFNKVPFRLDRVNLEKI